MSDNNDFMKRKRGAPRKVFTEENTPRRLETQLKTWVYNLVPHDRPLNDVLEELITAAFGNSEQRDLAELKKKAEEMEYELSKVKVEIYNIEESIKRKKELQKSITMQRKYIAFCLRRIAKLEYNSKKVTTRLEWLERSYGITFDVRQMDKFLKNSTLEDIERIPETEFIEEMNARKTKKGEKEEEIMKEIEEVD